MLEIKIWQVATFMSLSWKMGLYSWKWAVGVGFIGLNGAGNRRPSMKLTWRLIVEKYTSTLSANPREYRQQIGYIPETLVCTSELTLREHIETVAMAYGIEQNQALWTCRAAFKNVPFGSKLIGFQFIFPKGWSKRLRLSVPLSWILVSLS